MANHHLLLSFLALLILPACNGAARSGAENVLLSTSTSSPTHNPVAIPPRNSQGQIAFVTEQDGNKEIYLVNADGSNSTNLTNHPADDGYPVWSPDGSRIAFISNRDGNFEIYVMTYDGHVTNLSTHPDHDWMPAWSPDGTKIAFVTWRNTPEGALMSRSDIYVMKADGSNQTLLGTGEQATWSPDGTRIAFVTGFGEIYVVNADGSQLTLLRDSSVYPLDLIWSPDSRKLAFSDSQDINADSQIYTMNADGSQITLLTNTGWNSSPAWSLDGKQVAFWSDREGNNQIHVMDASGNNLTRLTSGDNLDTMPSWSPDGERIAFLSYEIGTGQHICIMYPNGSGLICFDEIIDGMPDATAPAWRP